MLAPPTIDASDVVPEIAARGFAALTPSGLAALTGRPLGALEALRPMWDDLPIDRHLRDGGRYRRRRHASYFVEGDSIVRAPHRAHWQPIDYNALHGGIERWFDPIPAEVDGADAWRALLLAFGRVASSASRPQRWFTEAHAFRIDTTDGIGRPTPEGAHRDGVDYVFIVLIDRRGIKGGETRVFDADGPAGIRFTMVEPFTTLLLDDARKLHETTPLQPTEEDGHRDTLVVTMRAGGFLAPP
ncbi:MAG: 2OG-Fe dioxygenase family protein [Polyangiaceae bacterium]